MVRRNALILGLMLLLPSPAAAQYIGGRPPEPPPAPLAGTVESTEAALARNVRLLAINPRNYQALLGAGRAALQLGDAQAAVGFFGRAEEISPAHWAPKAGQGSALAQMGEATAALGMFEQAQKLGATQLMLAIDRGLAFDLLGRQTEAQSDYRVVLGGVEDGEARRRLSLSLAISGRKAEALAMLDPLLVRRDAGARRTRAFILALGGDVEGARLAIGALMPGMGQGFDPFLRRLATLGPGQKAAAVHLGMMPAEGAALAAVEVEQPAPVALRAPTPVLVEVERLEPIKMASSAPIATVLPTVVATPPVREDRLAAIENVLTSIPITPPPPAPKPIVERPSARLAAGTLSDLRTRTQEPRKAAAKSAPAKSDKLAALGKAGAKTTAAKAKAEPELPKPAKAGASRIYVQLAGGSEGERMSREYDKIRARKAALFKGRSPLVSEVKGWARLLVGPFKAAEQAQDFVNDLHAAKLEGFVWTAPGGTKFEKLAAK